MNLIITQTQANYPILMVIFLLPCVVYVLNKILGNRLLLLGIVPRQAYGLLGVVFAPLLHADFNHLFFNMIPLLILGNFVLIESNLVVFIEVTVFVTLLSGILIWCFGHTGLHVGASALITGYWGFLISNILNQGTFITVILGLISLYYFVGLFFGIFPGKKGVSWEGHLFGLLAGIASSYVIAL